MFFLFPPNSFYVDFVFLVRGTGSTNLRHSEFLLNEEFWEDNQSDLIGTPLHEENNGNLDDDNLSNTTASCLSNETNNKTASQTIAEETTKDNNRQRQHSAINTTNEIERTATTSDGDNSTSQDFLSPSGMDDDVATIDSKFTC